MAAALVHAALSFEPNPDLGADPWPFILVMLAGFAIGIVGHVVRARALIVVGIGLIFLATFLLPLAANIMQSSG
jgi:hypothetical protein